MDSNIRPCTCHPDEAPVPCQRKYALHDCLRSHDAWIAAKDTTITRLTAENESLKAIIAAADRGTPIYKAVERVLDENSAWIARPSHEVTNAVALSAGIAWVIHYPLELADGLIAEEAKSASLTARVAELEAALKKIAAQKKTTELVTACDVEYADFEEGYDMCIDCARAASSPSRRQKP